MRNSISHYTTTVSKMALDGLSCALVKTLLYFDIFHYPLTAKELKVYCQGENVNEEEINASLKNLIAQQLIKEKDGFYFVENDETIVERRKAGNQQAEKYIKIALRFSKMIAHFPFVKGICISGSLSKGYMDSSSDIDYFIITAPGRLWICRTLLVLFKKIFLFNSHKYFCVNYFIDTQTLEIPDKNLFTATELNFIIPVYNYPLYVEIIKSNSWMKSYYPNFMQQNTHHIIQPKHSIVKNVFEWLLSGNSGEKLDSFCLRYTVQHWKKKFSYLANDHFDLNLRSRKNASKHHPQGFQWQVLQQHSEKIAGFEQKQNIPLN